MPLEPVLVPVHHTGSYMTVLLTTLVLGLLQAAPPASARTQPQAPPSTGAVTPESPRVTPSSSPLASPTSDPSSVSDDPYAVPEPAAPEPAAPPPAAPPAAPASDILYLPVAAPDPPAPDPAALALTDDLKYRRLVFSNYYSLNFGLSPIPSAEVSVFLGTNLRPRKSRLGRDWHTALGYQATLSVGLADAAFSFSQTIENYLNPEGQFSETILATLFHRHSLMAQGYGGRNGRLYYAMGAGAVMWRTLLVGLEGEGKLGYIFSAREGKRMKGVVGGQLRLGGPFEGPPLPQFGAFIGFMVF